MVLKPNDKDYIRFSFSSAIRNPTLPDQYLNLDVGPAVFLGNLGGFDSLLTVESFDRFTATIDTDELEYFDVAPIQPEKVKTFEVGYRSVWWKQLYIDASYYYNVYDRFIGFLIGLDVEFSNLNIPNKIDAFRVTANSENQVSTHGAAIGLNYYFKKYYQLSGNYTWSKLITQIDDDVIPAFNTPEHKFNISISGRDVPLRFGNFRTDNLGFNVTYKWVDGFLFEGSPQFTGDIESYGLLDAQINYKFEKINTTIKVGASNILNNLHFETVGGPLIGRLGYIRINYEFKKK